MTKEERELYDYYQRVISLQNERPALQRGSFFDLMYVNNDGLGGFDHSRHYAFLRSCKEETILVCANFSDEAKTVRVRIPAHAFDVLGIKAGTVLTTELISGERGRLELQPDGFVPLYLPANGAAMLSW